MLYRNGMRNTSAVSIKATERLNLIIQKSKRNRRRQRSTYQPLLLFPQPPHAQMMASVIIPAKNEAHHITKTLDALRLQRDEQEAVLPYHLFEVLLLANNCTDTTYEVAVAYQRQYPQFPLHVAQVRLEKPEAHIGTVRRMLMDEAYRRHAQNRRDGVILSTDADTEADKQWIAHTLREISNGCDAVGGRILAREVAKDSKLYYLQDITYRCLAARWEARIDPLHNSPKDCHFQCFGASLAVRCSAYHKAGRLPVIPFLEDEAFSRALQRVDAKVWRSPLVKVYTSSRLCGRVKAGLSVYLKHLGNLRKQKIVMQVEPAAMLAEKWTLRRQLRNCWQLRKEKKHCGDCVTSLCVQLNTSPKWLLREIDVSQYFGEFWEKAEHRLYTGSWRRQQHLVSIEKAIAELRRCLNE